MSEISVYEYTTYVPPGQVKCARCGFPIKGNQLAERSRESLAPGKEAKIVYRHSLFSECKPS